MTTSTYSIIVTSFDDDRYYGQLVLREGDQKKFICNVSIDLDDAYEEVNILGDIDDHVLVDFEVTNQNSLGDAMLDGVIAKKLRNEIFCLEP